MGQHKSELQELINCMYTYVDVTCMLITSESLLAKGQAGTPLGAQSKPLCQTWQRHGDLEARSPPGPGARSLSCGYGAAAESHDQEEAVCTGLSSGRLAPERCNP